MRGDGKRPDFEVIGVSEIYKTFDQRNLEEPISKATYSSIIKKYLTIYINELFFLNKPLYFPLMGKARLNKCGNWIKKDKSNMKVAQTGKVKKTDSSLGIYWYHRPFAQWYYYRLKKMTGSTNILPGLQKAWKETFEIQLLSTAVELKKNDEFRIVKLPKK